MAYATGSLSLSSSYSSPSIALLTRLLISPFSLLFGLPVSSPPVLFAIGRDACTDKIGLDTVGVKTNPKNLKVIVNEKDGSNIPYVHAIGDIADGKLELTPVAIQVSFVASSNWQFSRNKYL